jgi:hypothetical protein
VKIVPHIVCVAGLLSMHGAALAQHIYTCRDKGGHEITSDRPIPECADLPMQEHGRSGIVVRDIPAPLTPAQQAAQAEAEKQKRLQEESVRDKHRADVVLMSTYPDVPSIEVARSRALGDFQDSLRSANERMAGLLQDRQALQRESAPFTNANRPLPGNLQRSIDANALAISSEQHNIDDRKNDIARINARFDAYTTRLHDLELDPTGATNTSSVKR